MTAKDKAKELVKKFSSKLPYYSEKDNLTKSKQCAVICIDEIIKTLKEFETYKDVNPNLPIKYYQEVKNEINKL